jgi:putative tryptophan/tyrosine transport system substrate-binding protein
VFTVVNEPVAMGYVASLSRPGGNVTGFSNLEPVVGTKWLELLKDLAPQIRRIAVIFNPETNPSIALFVRSMDGAAQKLAVEVFSAPAHERADLATARSSTPITPGHSHEAVDGAVHPSEQY